MSDQPQMLLSTALTLRRSAVHRGPPVWHYLDPDDPLFEKEKALKLALLYGDDRAWVPEWASVTHDGLLFAAQTPGFIASIPKGARVSPASALTAHDLVARGCCPEDGWEHRPSCDCQFCGGCDEGHALRARAGAARPATVEARLSHTEPRRAPARSEVDL